MRSFVRHKLLKRSYQTFLDTCREIIIIYNSDNTYEVAKGDNLFLDRIPEAGPLSSLFRSIFLQNQQHQSPVDQKYTSFTDTSIFKKNNYHDFLIFSLESSKICLEYRILKIDDDVSIMYFMDISYSTKRIEKERTKLDILSQHYLYSMVVDLTEDSCQSPDVPELAGVNQDYFELKFSDWRHMITDMFLPEDKVSFLSFTDPDNIIDCLEKKPEFSHELKMRNLQGNFIWVRITFTRTSDFSRTQPIFLYTVQDIDEEMSHLIQQESIISAVKNQNAQLQSAFKEKNVFFASLTHEIRSPLNAIIGMNEIILRDTGEESTRAYAKDIQNAGKLLLHTINDILDFSRIEAGKMRIVPAVYSTKKLAQDIRSTVSIIAAEKNLSFVEDFDETMPEYLYGDSVRIKQIIINLLTNAIKYTHTGSVSFCMGYCDGALFVKVKDTGIGMHQKDMEKLFASYERIEEQHIHSIEGTGLGMSIVIRLLNQMGSQLEVESIYGKGSTFSFSLQQEIPDDELLDENDTLILTETETTPIVDSAYFSGANILVVDDLRTNLLVMKGLLKNSGITIDTATSGQEALSLIKTNPYDLIFLDHLMPNMDGIETLHRIRALGKEYSSIPIIALTANIMSDAKNLFKNAGFDDFVEKPIEFQQLESVLQKYLH